MPGSRLSTMRMRFLRSPLVRLWVVSTGLVALTTSCASSRREAQRAAAPQPLLFAQSSFFDDTIVAEAQLGPFRLDATSPTFNRQPPAPGEGVPVPVRGGTFGGRAERDVGTGFPRGPAEEGAFGEAGPGGGVSRRRGGAGGAGGAALPRQSMTVTLRSQSDEPATIRVVEVKSALGNFVPVPELVTLPPRGVQVLEPMRSAYPAAIDELELLLVLRNRGREESQVIHLRPADGLSSTR